MKGSRLSDRVALICFAVALLLLAGFHGMPVHSSPSATGLGWDTDYGWVIWRNLYETLRGFGPDAFDAEQMIAWAGLLAMVCMVAASPWLVRVLGSSRLLWWLLFVMSAGSVAALTGLIGWRILAAPPDPAFGRIHVGFHVLIALPVVHFTGVMFVRRRKPAESLQEWDGGASGD